MAKLIVSDGFQFDPGDFDSGFEGLNGTTEKTQDDLWRVAFSGGEAFVRGHDFTYDNNDTSSDKTDDIISTGDITSFSFNAPSPGMGVPGPAIIRIRDIDGLSGARVHNALESSRQGEGLDVFHKVFRGDDVLKGADQNDVLFGFTGDDKIKGNGGEDLIFGGKGQDKLYGGGDDTLVGDGSADTFGFGNGDAGKNENNTDQVYDFVSGQDSINFSSTGGSKSITHIDHHSGNSYITLEAHDGYDKMVIVVVDNDHVTKSDISFQTFVV